MDFALRDFSTTNANFHANLILSDLVTFLVQKFWMCHHDPPTIPITWRSSNTEKQLLTLSCSPVLLDICTHIFPCLIVYIASKYLFFFQDSLPLLFFSLPLEIILIHPTDERKCFFLSSGLTLNHSSVITFITYVCYTVCFRMKNTVPLHPWTSKKQAKMLDTWLVVTKARKMKERRLTEERSK